MAPVVLINVDRPGLPDALAVRGLIAIGANADPGAKTAAAVIIDHPTAASPSGNPDGWGIPLVHLIDGDEDAVIAALDGGADDAVSAQASNALIAARIAAIIRRSLASRWVRIGDLSIDTLDRTVTRAGHAIPLLPREYRLLLVLARAPGQTVPRQTLVSALCGLRFDPGTNVIEVHMSRLRAKLDRGFAVPMLHTERGQGYRLAPPNDARRIMSHNMIADAVTAR